MIRFGDQSVLDNPPVKGRFVIAEGISLMESCATGELSGCYETVWRRVGGNGLELVMILKRG